MLRINDRYFLGSFLKSLLFSIFVFLAIFLVVDVVEKVDDFIDKDAPFSIIVSFYLHAIPNYFLLMLPVAMLMASLYTMGQFVGNRELTALKSAGISLYRVVAPVLIFGLCVSLFSFWFGETIVSRHERIKTQIYQEQIKKRPRTVERVENTVFQDTATRLVSIGFYDGRKHFGTDVNITVLNGMTIDSTITAHGIVPDGQGWILQEGKIRDFSTGVEKIREFQELRTSAFSFNEDDVVAVQIKPEEMNVYELSRYILKLKRMGLSFEYWLVDYYQKFAFPFANFIVVLLGLSLATHHLRGGNAVGFGLCVFICFIYYVLMTFTHALGYKGVLSPVAAAWFSNVLFGIIGVGALAGAKK